MTSRTHSMRGDGVHPSPSSGGGAWRSLPLLDSDGAPKRLLLALLVLGALAGAPLGATGVLLGAFGGFVLGVTIAGVLTVAASLVGDDSVGD